MKQLIVNKRLLSTYHPCNLLILFILTFPICDIITGFLIFRLGFPESFIGSPSQLIRILFILVGFTRISNRNLYICIGVVLWIITIESLSFFYIPSISPFISGLNYGFKILYILVFYFWSRKYCNKSNQYLLNFQTAIFNATVIYSLGIIIPTILGIGEASYREGTFGQKGLLASGNAMGVFLGMMNCILLLQTNKSINHYLKCLTVSISLVLLATKTALALFLLSFGLMIFKTKPLKRYIIIAISIVIGIVYFDSIHDVITTVADVILFRFDKSDNVFTFLMSSRDTYISDAITEFLASPIWIIKLLIGGGAFMSFRSTYSSDMVFDTLENEFFDVFFMYGIIGLVLYISIMIFFYSRIYKQSKILAFLFLLFCTHSIFAGHVLFDGIPIISAVLIINMAKHSSFERRYLGFKI